MVDTSPSQSSVLWSYALVIAAGFAAWGIFKATDPAPLVVDTTGFSVFAPLYIAAQAIERFLEPFAARWNNTTAEKLALKKARGHKARLESKAAQGVTLEMLEAADGEVANREGQLAKAKSKRAIPLWAAATALALIVSAILGLGLIEAVSKTPPGSEFIRTVDVLLTGIAIGAGTKPLHDLISRIEKAKDNADPAAKPSVES